MISIKNSKEIECMREACKVVALVYEELENKIKPGMSTFELDQIAEKKMRSLGAIPAEKGYDIGIRGVPPFPASICVSINDEVISGCINLTGLLKIKTTHEFGESTVSKILDMVENASSKKSRSEAFISRFAHYYTPAVVYSALALAILPPIVSLLMGIDSNWSEWIYRALTFLVISCPCALVISIPLSFFAGIGGASNAGVLF